MKPARAFLSTDVADQKPSPLQALLKLLNEAQQKEKIEAISLLLLATKVFSEWPVSDQFHVLESMLSFQDKNGVIDPSYTDRIQDILKEHIEAMEKRKGYELLTFCLKQQKSEAHHFVKNLVSLSEMVIIEEPFSNDSGLFLANLPESLFAKNPILAVALTKNDYPNIPNKI